MTAADALAWVVAGVVTPSLPPHANEKAATTARGRIRRAVRGIALLRNVMNRTIN
jgi:hypothetical protein